MSNVSERNKRRVRLFVDGVLNEGRLDLIDELVADDFVGHVPWAGDDVRGRQGVRRLVASHRRAHPGDQVKIDDQVAEDDRVATRWRTAHYAGISIVRLLAGKQVDSHTEVRPLTDR